MHTLQQSYFSMNLKLECLDEGLCKSNQVTNFIFIIVPPDILSMLAGISDPKWLQKKLLC